MFLRYQLALIALLACIVVAAYQVFRRSTYSHWKKDEESSNKNLFAFVSEWEFASQKFDLVCENMFKNNSRFKNFAMSSAFKRFSQTFLDAVNRSTPTKIKTEGHSAQFIEQTKLLHYISALPFIQTVCETGFNYGHSSVNYLTANDKVIVHSFDLGAHQYSRPMASFLNATFPGRLYVHFGDSKFTVPQFIKENPSFRCDFMFVDGGHIYSVAKADLQNFASIASRDNLIMFDDYPADWGNNRFGKAWDDICSSGNVKELMRCTKIHRGMVLGKVVTLKSQY